MGLEQHIKQCQEKQQALQETINDLELKKAELKFRQLSPDTTRCCQPRDSPANWATTLAGKRGYLCIMGVLTAPPFLCPHTTTPLSCPTRFSEQRAPPTLVLAEHPKLRLWQQQKLCFLPGMGSGASSMEQACRQHLCPAVVGVGGQPEQLWQQIGVPLHSCAVVNMCDCGWLQKAGGGAADDPAAGLKQIRTQM